MPPALDVYKRQQGLQITIAECQQPGKHPALITLLALAFQIHLALCCHDGFHIVGLAQSFHPHISIHAQEDMFQIGTGKTVFRNLPDAAVFHIRAEDGGQHRTDLGFALTAVVFKSINSAMMYPFCSVNFVIIFLIFNNAFWFRLVVFLECK